MTKIEQPATFGLFQQEGYLTRNSILLGLNELTKANLDDESKGRFYSAYFQLSIGFERLMKLVLMLDYMSENSLDPPSNSQFRESYGHKIKSMYEKCESIYKKFEIEEDHCAFYSKGSLQWEVINLLHEFALSARYYNLDQITGGAKSKDPLTEWLLLIGKVSRQHLDKETLSELLQYKNIQSGVGNMGEYLFNFFTIEKTIPHAVWLVFSIFKPFYFLVRETFYSTMELKTQGDKKLDIPYMHEFFEFLLLNKDEVYEHGSWAS